MPMQANEIKDLINEFGYSTPVVAKIEKFEAIDQIDAVLRIPKMVVCALVATKRSKRSEKEPRNIEEYMLNCTVVSCY